MPTYFKPLRRKIGVLTLVLACVFAAGWIRSERVVDYGFGKRFQLISLQGGLYCEHATGELPFGTFAWASDSADKKRTTDPRQHSKLKDKWRYQYIGFGHADAGETQFYRVPYWFIVIPLTLLSAWLLLSTPRAKKPPKK